MLLMVLFFFFPCPFPQSTLEKLWFCGGGVFSPHLFAYTWVLPAMDGELGPFDWGFFGPCVFLSCSLSLCRPCPSTCLFCYGNA